MERCPTCNLQYKRKNKYNHDLTNTHLAADNQNFCQQCKRLPNLPDKRFHLQSNEHEKFRRMWYCETCKLDDDFITKSSHIQSAALIENEVFSRINNSLRDKTNTYINPDFEQVDNLNRRAIDECTQHFHRFKNNCETDVKFNLATYSNTN